MSDGETNAGSKSLRKHVVLAIVLSALFLVVAALSIGAIVRHNSTLKASYVAKKENVDKFRNMSSSKVPSNKENENVTPEELEKQLTENYEQNTGIDLSVSK